LNKIVAGSVAAAAGVVLLLGGAGTFALWNANTTADLGAISTGSLTLNSTARGVWTTGTPSLWVPGDSSNYTESFTITGTGDNLQATLTGAYSEIAVSGVTADFTFEVRDKSGKVVPANAANAYNFTSALSPYTAVTTVDVDFDATGSADQKTTVDLGDVSVSLAQVTATAAR
jgi:alternate signal-mediated exported protein